MLVHHRVPSTKQLGALPLLPGWDASPSQAGCDVSPSQGTQHEAARSIITPPVGDRQPLNRLRLGTGREQSEGALVLALCFLRPSTPYPCLRSFSTFVFFAFPQLESLFTDTIQHRDHASIHQPFDLSIEVPSKVLRDDHCTNAPSLFIQEVYENILLWDKKNGFSLTTCTRCIPTRKCNFWRLSDLGTN